MPALPPKADTTRRDLGVRLGHKRTQAAQQKIANWNGRLHMGVSQRVSLPESIGY
jgi:hypothetical protein